MQMRTELTVPPAREPVSLAELKDFMRLSREEDDAMLNALIIAARQHCEDWTGRALIRQQWQGWLDDWPRDGVIALPFSPLLSVEDVVLIDRDEEVTLLPANQMQLDRAGVTPRLLPKAGYSWPSVQRDVAGIRVRVWAGYGEDWNAVPYALRLGILQVAAHLYGQGGIDGTGQTRVSRGGTMPRTTKVLWQPYRRLNF